MTTSAVSPALGGPAPHLCIGRTLANLAIAAGALLMFAFVLLLYGVGAKFDEIFRDFGTTPNPVAAIFLAAARLLASAGSAGAVILAALAAGVVILVGCMGRRSPVLMVLIVLVPLVLLPLFVLSMYEPLGGMIASLQNTPPPSAP